MSRPISILRNLSECKILLCSKQMSVFNQNSIYIQPRGYCITKIKNENEIDALYYMLRNDTRTWYSLKPKSYHICQFPG